MKDYSKFIPSPYGFITKTEIVNGEIHIYTPETKKGEPHKYPATKEYIDYFEARLETQYQLIAENRKVIEEYISNKEVNKYMPLGIGIGAIFAIIGFILLFANTGISALWCIPSFATTVSSILISERISSQKVKQFNDEMDVAEAYLKNRENMEQLSKEDKNITAYLSNNATLMLENNQNLAEIEHTFNIDFLDKASLKDLKQLLLRYMISKSLKEEQKFIEPESDKMYIYSAFAKKKKLELAQNKKINE